MAVYGVRNKTTVSPPHLLGKMVLMTGFNGSGLIRLLRASAPPAWGTTVPVLQVQRRAGPERRQDPRQAPREGVPAPPLLPRACIRPRGPDARPGTGASPRIASRPGVSRWLPGGLWPDAP